MANPTSALDGHWISGHHGMSPAGVSVEQIAGFSLWQVASWPETIHETAEYVNALGGDALRIEPLKWWVTGASELASSDSYTVLDLTASRCWLRLSGPNAAQLLNHFLPLDLSDVACPLGSVRSSGFHHIGITLWRTQDGFNLFLPRSFAASLWELIYEVGAQYGIDCK